MKTKKCKYCQTEMDAKAKVCPKCGQKQKLPFWVILIIIIFVVGVLGSLGEQPEEKTSTESKNKVTIVDFSSMTKADIDTWCKNNKVNCVITDQYSDNVAKGNFVSQSVATDKQVYEGDKITIVFSLGKEPTTEQKNALKQAETYSSTMHMSKQAIYDQLVSEYGGQFDAEAAQYAVDNVEADWNTNALESAKSYQETLHMSKSAIYDQLISEYGGQFTKEEAQYAIDHLE